MEIIDLSLFVRSHKQTRKVCVRERAGTVWRMAGGAEQAGGPPDSAALQPTRSQLQIARDGPHAG